jgi:hypothetical protein
MVPAGVMVFPCLYVINNWSGLWDEPRKVCGQRDEQLEVAIDHACCRRTESAPREGDHSQQYHA